MDNQVKKEKEKNKKDYIFAVGRRREAVARVRLYQTIKDDLMFGENPVKKGVILVNKMPIADYFKGETAKMIYNEPFIATGTTGKFAVTAVVAGGGRQGQLVAFVHGISRALASHDTEKLRKILKKKGFLTRDARTRERRKTGTGGKARRQKQSPKR